MLRWRVIIKVWDKDARPSVREEPVYRCAKWHDSEPSWSDIDTLLNGVMERPRYSADRYYGEATREQVMHTHRSRFVLA